MKRTFIIAGLLAGAAAQLAAQNIKGIVVDVNRQPIEAATVIMQTPDSTFINAVVTDSSGCFSFQEKPESYRLIFQHLLFKTYEKEGKGSDVGVITLDEQNYTLDEIVVKGEHPQVKVENGSLIYDISLLTERTTVSNAYESILRLPGIREHNDAILLTGAKDVNIVINGKPSSMNMDQLITMLKSTPVSNVKNIEVVYNAPAKYRVRGAMINVVLKNTKSDNPFLRGEVSGNFKQSAYANGGGNANLSYSGRKVSADLSYSPSYSHIDNNVEVLSHHIINNQLYDINQNNEGYSQYMIHNVRLAVDYQPTENSNLSAAYTSSFKTDGKSRQQSSGNFSQSDNYKSSEEQMHNINIDYTAAFGLNVGLDYTYYNSPSLQDFANESAKSSRHFLVDEKQRIDRWNVYARQTHALSNNWNLNYGINFTFANEKSSQFYRPQDDSDLSDLNTDTEMKEKTYNFYAGFEKAFSSQLSMSFSLAGEYYKLTDYRKWAIYPTFQLSYQLSPEHIFQLGFSSNKNYPSYWTLQNTVGYLNGYMKTLGNPSLLPSTDYTADLTYILKGKYMVNIYYSYIKDHFEQLPYQSPDELSLIYQTINYDYEQNLGITLMIPFAIGNFGNTQLVLDGSYNKDVCNKYHDISFNRSNFRGVVQLNNSFRIASQPNIRLELNGTYVSPTLQGIYDVSTVWRVDAGLKWTFADRKAELKIQGNDLFNTFTPDGSIDYKGQRLNMNLNNINRNLTVTFTYKFNGYKTKQHKEIDTSRFGY